jgi:hypothetical protein
MNSQRTADSAGAKLRRVLGGHEVAVIELPDDHRILVDAVDASADRYLCARLNAHGAFCWARVLRQAHVKGWLHDANGAIATAPGRRGCAGWPSRYQSLTADGDGSRGGEA